MSKRNAPRRILSEASPLLALSVVAAVLLAVVAPASAQFFDFGFGRSTPRSQQQSRGFGGGFFQQMFPGPSPQPQQQQRAVDFSRAPPPEKRETPAEHNVLVLGDAMADWLAYGLEEAFTEQPDMGVIRKHKAGSGLIRYQPKGEPADWAAAAKSILAKEKPDAIVVMLGLNDRIPIREVAAKAGTKNPADKKGDKTRADEKAGAKASDAASTVQPSDNPSDLEQNGDELGDDAPSIVAPEKAAHSANGIPDFREDRWVELYRKKIEEMITVLKSRGVPVVWVGLPAVRGQKATSDMLFLDALYRDAAGKAGITYVDVWDGFVDEAGRFITQGPDFEGQIRRLRAADGVFFTSAGARKLAHYVEREIMRLLAGRTIPIALPSEPAVPDANARPGGPAPRPLAGPIVPLVASSVGTDELLGGPGTRPASVDALAARTLVKGEALAAPAGRADDPSWPRREVGRLEPAKDIPLAAPSQVKEPSVTPVAHDGQSSPRAAPKKKRVPSAASPPEASGFDARPATSPQQARPRPRDDAPRPPGIVGQSAFAPSGFFAR